MADQKACGCKGIRTCLQCENDGVPVTQGEIPCPKTPNKDKKLQRWHYCRECQKAWKEAAVHPQHGDAESMAFPGITIIPHFVTEEEEKSLVQQIDSSLWSASQSGRKKQDFGPKVNFKKKKLKLAKFTGLPNYSKFIYDRMLEHDSLKDFIPVELCNLEYIPERGSAIDPHFDDFWLWGERLVTLNLLSGTFLSMTKDGSDVEVAVPMDRRSLIVVQGAARYEWKHAVIREDVRARRLATTLRELTPEFLYGGSNELLGRQIIDLALTFTGAPIES